MKTQQQRKESKERENEKEKDKLGNCVIHSRETNAKGEGDRKNREVGVPELFVRSIVRLFIRSLARETERGRLGLGLGLGGLHRVGVKYIYMYVWQKECPKFSGDPLFSIKHARSEDVHYYTHVCIYIIHIHIYHSLYQYVCVCLPLSSSNTQYIYVCTYSNLQCTHTNTK